MILAALPGMGPVSLRRLDERMPDGVEGLLGMEEESLAAWCGPREREELREWRRYCDPDRVGVELERLGADYVTFEEGGYPERLEPYGDRPVGLYRCRAGVELGERCLAVVGTRSPSGYGRKVAREFTTELVRAGYTIVSGMAEGIDTEAHRAALGSGGRTAAFLGGGLNRCYPASNRRLMAEIAESAGVWTEFPLWRSADRRSFPQRNRIVSGVSEGVLVVESGPRGGSLITARLASEQGKPVYVVPGRIDAPESAGCHALIRDGAQLVSSVEEILADLSALPEPLRGRAAERPAGRPEPGRPELDGVQSEIWDLVESGGKAHPDRMAGQLGRPIPEISRVVLEMELSGLLVRRLDGCYETR